MFPVQGPSLRVVFGGGLVSNHNQSSQCAWRRKRGAQVSAAVAVDDKVFDPLRGADACGNDLPFVVLGPGRSTLCFVSAVRRGGEDGGLGKGEHVLGDYFGAICLVAIGERDVTGCVVGARDDVSAQSVPVRHRCGRCGSGSGL